MISEQYFVFFVLAAVLILFIWGRLRYDLVAILALLALSLTGIIPGEEAFLGFGHPAVITVAAVLILSRAMMNAGLVDYFSRILFRKSNNSNSQLAVLVVMVAFCSAFMNNVGALAIFMPIALRVARKNKQPASLFLMPLSFGSILGGMLTQIGTPPNIIISIFREETVIGMPFKMFDFTPVGLGAVIPALLFIILLGWRLIPCRSGQISPEDLFDIDSYLTEVYVPSGSKYIGKRLIDLGHATEGKIVVVGHVRNKRKLFFFSPYRVFQESDHIIIRANAEDLAEFLDVTDLKLTESGKLSREDLRSDEISIIEAVVTANSVLEGQTARSLNLRSVYGINMLGISREGTSLKERPDRIKFRGGDVLMLQGRMEVLREVMSSIGCLPLLERGIRLDQPRRILLCLAIFAAALVVTAAGYIPIQIAFIAAAVAMLLTGFVTLREVYDNIDWPVIVLLGAMIPVSRALETTGGAQTIANIFHSMGGDLMPWAVLAAVMTITIMLTNVINNAAATLLMAPIALSIAQGINVSVDPLLMAVCIGASSAFLTPIGHQSNTLVMGPGGYHFGDYWKMGLPLSIIIVTATVPLIMLVWPL